MWSSREEALCVCVLVWGGEDKVVPYLTIILHYCTTVLYYRQRRQDSVNVIADLHRGILTTVDVACTTPKKLPRYAECRRAHTEEGVTSRTQHGTFRVIVSS